MARNLVVCCDGTWNTPNTTYQGKPNPTNVLRLYRIAVNDDSQITYYHKGVGTDGGQIAQDIAGATGAGLTANVRAAYVWLAQNYQPDDRIFLFGFSRGAYTARAIAGVISQCGLLDFSATGVPLAQQDAVADGVFKVFRQPNTMAPLAGARFFNTAADRTGAGQTRIWFVGVWDTVGALGIPRDLPLIGMFEDLDQLEFSDTKLSPAVDHARHAVALDEMRAAFLPTLWTNETARNIEKDDTIVQVWFAGAHGDVGGGYAEGDTGLADGALAWMLDEAVPLGLQLLPDARMGLQPDPLATLHDSVTSIFKLLPTAPRIAPWLDATVVPNYQSDMVTKRMAAHLDPRYRPTRQLLAVGDSAQFVIAANQPWNPTHLYLKAAEAYQFAAVGSWKDGMMETNPAGAAETHSLLPDAQKFVSDAVSDLMKVYQEVTQNKSATFWDSRRQLDAQWLALVGVVANGISGDVSVMKPNEHVIIGSGLMWSPQKDGYLYAFANDAWAGYDNNSGTVTLTVTRTA